MSLLTTALTRSLTCDSLRREELAKEVEKEVFAACNNLVGSRYRKLTRKVVFGLRGDSEAREQLVGGERGASRVVKTYLTSLTACYTWLRHLKSPALSTSPPHWLQPRSDLEVTST